uniref:Ig-like domain-containing protein n=1 Tax=Sinocyclocheilus rhinocerous TaxID=307959 RepID=A0A673FKA8_9TELE
MDVFFHFTIITKSWLHLQPFSTLFVTRNSICEQCGFYSGGKTQPFIGKEKKTLITVTPAVSCVSCVFTLWLAAFPIFQNVSLPKTLNSTSGSCLLIPCLFNISKEKENILDSSPEATWRRGSLWSLYDTDRFTIDHRQKEPVMEVLGDLRKKNCTSVMRNLSSLYSDRYYFRIQAENFGVTGTRAVQHKYSLAEPNVTVPVLREGEEVNLTCTVPAPCPSHPPNVIWAPTLGGDVTQRTQLNTDGTQTVSAILNFVPSFHHHELKVNCVSIHPLHREDRPLLSHKMVILSLVWLGDKVTLTCQSNANPPAVHRWFKKRAGVEEGLGISHVLSFTAAHENTGEYICEAQNLYDAMNSTNLQITVIGQSVQFHQCYTSVFLKHFGPMSRIRTLFQ